MRKQVRQYLKRSLCGILSAAMILTGSSLSGLTVYAEESEVKEEVQTNDADGITDADLSEENNGVVQNPDVGDNTDGNEDGTDGDDADQNDSNGQEQTGDDETLPDDGEGDGEEEVAGDDEEAAGDDDATDNNSQTDGTTGDKTDDDEEEVSDEKTVLAAADGSYTDQPVTLNYYVGELGADETVGFYKWNDDGGAITVDTTANPLLSWGGWGNASKNPVYTMNSVEGYTGWYNITFTVTDTLTAEKSLTGFSVFLSSNTGSQVFECSGFSNAYPEIYAGLLSGEITAVKGGKGYASIADAEVSTEALAELVAEAKKLNEEDYKVAGWKVFAEALTAAEEVLAKDEPTSDEVQTAYENLEKAKDALVPITVVDAEINVKPVALADDFITGADISSYWSLKQSGTVFKDEEGNELSDAAFFKYLHDGGTNWIRIRVWNDPYDSNKNGYGGGNNDLDKAKIMGKLATDAGMRVLIDFHYSDFWADPGKQQAPKAWAGMSVDEKAEAVYQFTKDSLNELKSAGVDVGMVQVGNETTNGICGVFYSSDGWAEAAKIYNAGSKAVREFDENCLVAIHFTNPERSGNYANFAKNLDAQKVDYDVFASSYYPFWHGTTENLTSVLANVAKTYGKKVMVAETSWATTLDDQDGHDNTVRKGANDTNQPYAFSLQGQADEIRAVVEAANNINNVEGAAGSSIGVFYWEAAWLSPYYVYEEDGSKNEELLNKNKAAWEQYGSGWAASYGGDYDPEDAGKWYGGSAVDNQAWFGFDGAALPTAKIYSYIRTGAETEKAVSDVKNPSVTIKAGETVDYPEKVTVIFNDGTSAECPVEWNQEDQAELDTNEPGDHTVRGIATCEYMISDGSIKTATRSVTLTITVEMTLVAGLINPGFEDADMSAWTITGSGTARKEEDPRTGTYGVHFYHASAVTSTVMQKIENLDAGTYIFGGYIQGDTFGTTAEAVAKVYDSAGTLKDTKKASCTTAGWKVWQNPEVVGIVVAEGDYLEVGMEVNAAAAGWGTIDDFYLYQAYAYDILVDDQIKNGTLTSSAAKSVSGETITLTATPDTGYALYQLKVSGRSVTGDTLTSDHGTVTYDEKTKTAVLTYSDKIVDATKESFTMPNGKVTVSAVFRTDVDISALDELVTEYEKVTNDGYTEESWKNFTDALEAAKATVENLEATQAEIDSAKEALEAAYNGLEAPAATPEEIAALQTLITEYEKVENDGYTEESWKNFTDALAAAKVAAEKENVTTAEIAKAKESLETARKELKKESTGETADLTALNGLIAQYDSVTNDGYTEESWKTFTDALAAAKETAAKENVTQAEVDAAKEVLETAYKGLTKAEQPEHHEGLWIAPIEDQTYTGAAIKPEIEVRHDDKLLDIKKDYTVTYKNNTNAGTATVTVKGKGNFKGSDTATFEIKKKDIDDEDITVADVYAVINNKGKVNNPKVAVKYGKKTLKANNDYKVIYPELETEKDADGKDQIVAKDYTITIETAGVKKNNKGELLDSANYTGSRTIKYTVRNSDTKLMSKAVIRLEKTKVDYAGVNGADTEKPAVTSVKIGGKDVPDTEYTVSYENWDQAGKATVTVTAKEGTVYYGSKSVTYTVNGTKLTAAVLQVEGINAAYEYTGSPVYVSAEAEDPAMRTLKVTKKKTGTEEEKLLAEGTDYTVSYKTGKKLDEHTNAGTVTVTITGINAYTGSVNKTFKITPVDLAAYGTDKAPAGLNFTADKKAKYSKTGAKPENMELTFNGQELVEKQDYTVSYQKNTKVESGKESATMLIKGKGNFKGQIRHEYEVTMASEADVYATAADIVKPAKLNQVKSAVKVFEASTGKALKAGTDYDKVITYYSDEACTTQITAENFEAATAVDQVIYAKVTMKGNYAGTGEAPGSVTTSFRVYDKDLKMTSKKLVVTVDTTTDKDGNPIACDTTKAKNPYYTGAAIEPKVTVTLKGSGGAEDKVLTEDTDYTVAYTNNTNKGKATITLTGIGNGYGGTKSVKFTIVSKEMKWYEAATQRIATFFSNLF